MCYKITHKLNGYYYKSVLISNKNNSNDFVLIKGKWKSKEQMIKIAEATKKILEEKKDAL